jgi:hypothetical protein
VGRAFEPKYVRKPVPVYVMLPLNVVTNDGEVNDPEALERGLRALSEIGVEGVMIDVWWGIVERDGPRKYDWAAYREVMDMIKDAGLKVQAVMSFHACGANVARLGPRSGEEGPRLVLHRSVRLSEPGVYFALGRQRRHVGRSNTVEYVQGLHD